MIDKISEVLHQQFLDTAIPSDCSKLSLGDLEGWDSLAHLNLLLAVEEAFEVKFTLEEMSEIKSVGQMIQALQKHGKS